METTFRAALPYGAASLGLAAGGIVLAATSSSTLAVITGIALAAIGVGVFMSVLLCGVKNSSYPEGFRREVKEFAIVGAGAALANVVQLAVEVAVRELVRNLCQRRGQERRSY